MKHLLSLALGLWSFVAVGGPVQAEVGQPFPKDIEFKDIAQSPAKSFEDFSGRLVLVELFAYW